MRDQGESGGGGVRDVPGWDRTPPLASVSLGVFEVLGGIGLVVDGVAGAGVRLDDDFEELEVVCIVLADAFFLAGFEFEKDVEGPVGLGVDGATGADAEDGGDFEEKASRGADHLFDHGVIDLRLELVEEEMINHEPGS